MLKYSKAVCVLFIYSELKSRYSLRKSFLSSELGISFRTIERYVAEVNSYLAEFNTGEVIIHTAREGYKLYHHSQETEKNYANGKGRNYEI